MNPSLGKRSLLVLVALIAAVNFPLLGKNGILPFPPAMISLIGLARLSVAFDLGFALWCLFTFWGKRSMKPEA